MGMEEKGVEAGISIIRCGTSHFFYSFPALLFMPGPPLCDVCIRKYDDIGPICPVFPVPLPMNTLCSLGPPLPAPMLGLTT